MDCGIGRSRPQRVDSHKPGPYVGPIFAWIVQLDGPHPKTSTAISPEPTSGFCMGCGIGRAKSQDVESQRPRTHVGPFLEWIVELDPLPDTR